MSNYTNRKTLGTKYYKDKLKYNYLKNLKKYSKKHCPNLLIEAEPSGKKHIPQVSKDIVLDTYIYNN